MKHSQSNISPEERHRRKTKYNSLLILLTIMIVVSITTMVRNETAVDFDWSETQVRITDPSNNAFTVIYAEITALDLVKHPNYGECLSGKKTSSWIYGTWKNDEWDTYTLCASAATSLCIVMQTQQETIVISYESDEITSALFHSLKELILI